MKGGSLLLTHIGNSLLLDTDPQWINRIFSDKCVQFFIENVASVQGISDGSLYGMIFTLNLLTGVPDVFINDQVENTGIPVRTILMKITYIKHSKDEDHCIIRPAGIHKMWANVNEFKSETETQQNIYAETSQLGEPACPSILHSECLNRSNSQRLMNKLFPVSNPNAQGYIRQIAEIMTYNRDIVLGVTLMDFMNGYQPIHAVLTNQTLDINLRREVATCAIYQNIRLMSLGYVHSDLHLANTMVNMRGQNFLQGQSYKCIIIDFGRTLYNEKLVLDMLKLKIEVTRPYVEHVLSVLYQKYRNPEYPENYLIPQLQQVGIFSTYDEILPYLLTLFQRRIAKIDELVIQNKYSDNTTALCTRSYIDKRGHMVINGITFPNVYYVQYASGIDKKVFHIDIQKRLPYKEISRVSDVMKETVTQREIYYVLDFDICIYYISKNPRLGNKPLINVVKDYFLQKRTGYFNPNCDRRQLYLNAITKSNKYIVGASLNPILHQFFTNEYQRLLPVALPTREDTKPVKKTTLSKREKLFMTKRHTGLREYLIDDHRQIYDSLNWIIGKIQARTGTDALIVQLREYMAIYDNAAISEAERLRELNQKLALFRDDYNGVISGMLQYDIDRFNRIMQKVEEHTTTICSQNHRECPRFTALVAHYKDLKTRHFDLILRDIIENKHILRIDDLTAINRQFEQDAQEAMRHMAGGRKKTKKQRKSKRKTRKN
jgi:hypothetical protein